MKTSRKGRHFIQRHEGLRLMPYKVGAFEEFWTVGYGHYGPDVRPGVPITERHAKALLNRDLEVFEDAVNNLVRCDLTQPEFDALVSFTFNLGTGALATSTLLRRLNEAKNPKRIFRNRVYREELPKWVKAGGQTLPGLVTRRAHEVRLATEGKYR